MATQEAADTLFSLVCMHPRNNRFANRRRPFGGRRSRYAPRYIVLRIELLETRDLLSVSPSSLSIGSGSPVFSGGTQKAPISITLPSGSIVDKVDVDLLLDDTGSFQSFAGTVGAIFKNLETDLQSSLPGVDFGFGVTRFEDYGGTAGTAIDVDNNDSRPFILNQPIVNNATAAAKATTVGALIDAALSNTAPGGGGDTPEAMIEALYQTATGAGFDGNANGDTTESGPAGAQATQTSPGNSGDVPAFSTNVLPASGTLGGVGWRAGALHLVILATDTAPAAAFIDSVPTTITGAGGSSVPFTAFENAAGRVGPVGTSVPPGGADVQSTVNALNALGIRVLGMGPSGAPTTSTSPSSNESTWLSAIGRLTGALDSTGNPLVFDTSVTSTSLTSSIANAITTTAKLPVDLGLTTTTLPAGLKFTDLTGVVHQVAPGGTASFNVAFTATGTLHDSSFDIKFIDTTSNAVLGTIPVQVSAEPSPTTVSISSVTAHVATHGQTPFVFTVSLSSPSREPVTVPFATHDGTAHAADGAYQPTHGLLTFAPGTTSQVITVLVNGATVLEPDEAFTVNLVTATGIVTAQGTGTILTDGTQVVETGITVLRPVPSRPVTLPLLPHLPLLVEVVVVPAGLVNPLIILPRNVGAGGYVPPPNAPNQPNGQFLRDQAIADLYARASHLATDVQEIAVLTYLADADQPHLLGIEPGDEVQSPPQLVRTSRIQTLKPVAAESPPEEEPGFDLWWVLVAPLSLLTARLAWNYMRKTRAGRHRRPGRQTVA
jgi:hypothetical protein